MPRPPREPLTAHELSQVETLSGLGLSVFQIADALRMSKRTLERRLRLTSGGRRALARGRAIAFSAVTKSLYQAAVGGQGWAVCFYLKTRGGKRWREKDRVEVTGKDGKPIEHRNTVEFVSVEKLENGAAVGDVRLSTVRK